MAWIWTRPSTTSGAPVDPAPPHPIPPVPVPADRRRRVVEITAAGRGLLAEIAGTGDQMTDRILAEAGVEPRSFRAGLQALIDASDDAPAIGRGPA